MMDLLSKLSDTPVPNVLVIAGIVFLLLAVAGKVGANLSVPPNRQKTAAFIGSILLVCGIAMFMAPNPQSQNGSLQGSVLSGQTNQGESDHLYGDRNASKDESTIDRGVVDDMTKAAIEAAIKAGGWQEQKARRHLDPSLYEMYYEGEVLKTNIADIDSLKRINEFRECNITDRVIHSIDLDKGVSQAVVDMTESWDCAAYSTVSGDCLGQYPSVLGFRQTLLVKLRESGWMVNTVKFAEDGPEESYVSCTDKWPKNIQFLQ